MQEKSLKEKWEYIENYFSEKFGEGEKLSLESIVFLIGVQELGQIHRKFKKDEKANLIHISICRLLEPYGYYKFDYFDAEGWPHYTLEKPLPQLKAGEQAVLLKQAIVLYFEERNFF